MEIKGLNQVISDIRKFGAEADRDIQDVTQQAARNIEKYAKENVNANSSNLGDLGQSINAVEKDKYNWSIIANNSGIAPYAPFVEFGTGGLVEVPEELKEIAIKFKGKGIRLINLRARPYLYPALLRGRIEYLDKLKKVLEKYGKVK